jgi:hypothetical protein
MVARAISAFNKSPGGTVEANPALARAYYRAGGNVGYLVPGDNGNVCTVEIVQGELSRVACGSSSGIATKGTTSTTVVRGGYEVSGLLPRGTRAVSITGADGHTSRVEVDAYGGFDFVGTGSLARVSYTLPDGREEIDSSQFPASTAHAG